MHLKMFRFLMEIFFYIMYLEIRQMIEIYLVWINWILKHFYNFFMQQMKNLWERLWLLPNRRCRTIMSKKCFKSCQNIEISSLKWHKRNFINIALKITNVHMFTSFFEHQRRECVFHLTTSLECFFDARDERSKKRNSSRLTFMTIKTHIFLHHLSIDLFPPLAFEVWVYF